MEYRKGIENPCLQLDKPAISDCEEMKENLGKKYILQSYRRNYLPKSYWMIF